MLKIDKIITIKSLFIAIIFALWSHCYGDDGGSGSGGFLHDERYRGWLWFEDRNINNQIIHNKLTNPSEQDAPITPAQAKQEIETFAKELEELKFMMLARPTPENVRNYREKEKLMWQKAEELHDSWDMANLVYPQQRDLINNPVNVHAVKAKRELEAQEQEIKIKQLAEKFDLVLFFNSSCKYCQLLSPVLRAFGETYGFNIEAISSDNTQHEYFKTNNTEHATKLIANLGITAFPTVIAISFDGKTAFELIRGYVSQSELEEYSLLAVKYLQNEAKIKTIESTTINKLQHYDK